MEELSEILKRRSRLTELDRIEERFLGMNPLRPTSLTALPDLTILRGGMDFGILGFDQKKKLMERKL